MSDASGYILIPPDAVSVVDLLSVIRSPTKENNSCLSSGLTVRDSAAPLNFLSEPLPLYLGTF